MEETTPGSSRVSVRNGDAQGSRVDGVMVSGLGGGGVCVPNAKSAQ